MGAVDPTHQGQTRPIDPSGTGQMIKAQLAIDPLTCPQMAIDPLTCPQNGLMGHRTGHRRRCWGQVRFEYSGQMTSLTFCNMSTAAWEVRVALGRLVVSIFRSMPDATLGQPGQPNI